MNKKHYFTLTLLTLANIFSFADRTIISVLAVPIKKGLDISDTQLSYLMGLSFALFYCIIGIPISFIADNKSRKKIIVIGIFIWGLTTLFSGFVSSFLMLLIMRIGVAIGESTLSPSAHSIISDTFDRKNLSIGMSIFAMGIYLGSGLSMLAAGGILNTKQITDFAFSLQIQNWQIVFIIIGFLTLLVGVLCFFIVEPKRGIIQKIQINDLLLFLKSNKSYYIRYILCFAMIAIANFSCTAWIPSILVRNYTYTVSDAAIMFGTITCIFSSVGIFIGGRIADYFDNTNSDGKKLVTIISIIGYILAIISFTIFVKPLVFIAAISFFSSFASGAGTAAIQEIAPTQMRAKISALFLFVVNLVGLGFGPTLVALITDYWFQNIQKVNYSLSFICLIALSLAFLLIWGKNQKKLNI